MKGIILAGGTGTRLHPITLVISKQLLPVYDKPMIYYPLSTLMLAGIRDIQIITTLADQCNFIRLLGDGSQWGLKLSYAVQEKPEGLAQAFVIGRDFAQSEPVVMILGDNIFHGAGLGAVLQSAVMQNSGATVFAYRVRDPQRFGVVEFDSAGKAVTIEEKPAMPRSDWALTGLYIFDGRVSERAASLKASARGEYEITDIITSYLESDELHVVRMGRGITWFDTGTYESLLDAALFIRLIEDQQKLKIACLDEIAWQQEFISDAAFKELLLSVRQERVRDYLSDLLQEKMGERGTCFHAANEPDVQQ
ncbi:MAG TPA: glucose-1-phosphate thymidylyltransferase RfbA [Rhizomicrobium sp.]|nr:glucose-1-phosphate thymidylyltransferase RfbA [Rhizomicrobium sp.]